MKSFFYLALFFFLGAFCLIRAEETAQFYENLIRQSQESEKSALEARLAKALYKEQELEKAIRVFLQALQHAEKKDPSPKEEEEEKLYADALRLYLNAKEAPHETGKALLAQFLPFLEKNPHFYSLGYLVSIAYANLNRFEEFFETFYRSYLFFPTHYLSYKTQAILYIKLFERARSLNEKELFRQKIFSLTQEALNQFAGDIGLYKLSLVFAPEAQKKTLWIDSLNKIIAGNMIIPRQEIAFYATFGKRYGQKDLILRFLQKARSQYPYSRTIDAIQQELEKE